MEKEVEKKMKMKKKKKKCLIASEFNKENNFICFLFEDTNTFRHNGVFCIQVNLKEYELNIQMGKLNLNKVYVEE